MTIKRVFVRWYRDTGQVIAHVQWTDKSLTQGDRRNPHMAALFARAQRDGLAVERERW